MYQKDLTIKATAAFAVLKLKMPNMDSHLKNTLDEKNHLFFIFIDVF
jgi:hypothetical protein